MCRVEGVRRHRDLVVHDWRVHLAIGTAAGIVLPMLVYRATRGTPARWLFEWNGSRRSAVTPPVVVRALATESMTG